MGEVSQSHVEQRSVSDQTESLSCGVLHGAVSADGTRCDDLHCEKIQIALLP